MPIAHVEAGLRSFDLSMPEERNRIAVDRISALLLCPDERSARQLESEGVDGRARGRRRRDGRRQPALRADRARALAASSSGSASSPAGYLLVTVHREANVRPDRLRRIVEGLNRLEEPIVFPAHPRTRAALERLGPRRLRADRPARLPRLRGARVARRG